MNSTRPTVSAIFREHSSAGISSSEDIPGSPDDSFASQYPEVLASFPINLPANMPFSLLSISFFLFFQRRPAGTGRSKDFCRGSRARPPINHRNIPATMKFLGRDLTVCFASLVLRLRGSYFNRTPSRIASPANFIAPVASENSRVEPRVPPGTQPLNQPSRN